MKLKSYEINPSLYYVGVNDRDTQLFENMWPLPNGVAYNSYIIKGEKNALIDTVKVSKQEEFIEKVSEILGDEKLDYLVVNHMEPDHSGAIDLVREKYPEVIIVGNKKSMEFLNSYYGIEDHLLEVKEGDKLDLGNHELTFYMTPMVHWPESMVSYDEENKALFSQDIFGSYGCLNGGIFDDQVNTGLYREEAIRYYANIVGKYSAMAKKALDKLDSLEIDMILPVHGLIWRSEPEKIMNLYKDMASFKTEEGVVLVYGSMYGNTQQMAEVIGRSLSENGVKTVISYDVSKANPSYIMRDIWKYKGLILGSCSYANNLFPAMQNLVNIIKINNVEDHILGLFGSYSWSGGGLRGLEASFEKSKFQVLETKPNCKGRPDEENLKACSALAKEMAQALKEDK